MLPGIDKYGGAVYVCSFLQKKIDTIHSFAANEDLIIKRLPTISNANGHIHIRTMEVKSVPG